MAEQYHYPGRELQVFGGARKWKQYLAEKLKPYISGRVLEVGAGIGETTGFLLNEKTTTWTCLEPDPDLFNEMQKKKTAGLLPANCILVNGTLPDHPSGQTFDTILYIDVLEHIENDQEEIRKAISLLAANGRLVVLSPAYDFLYSPFDKAIGHYRRYNKRSLRRAVAFPELTEQKMFFLESAGVFLLLLNKFVARKKYPTARQVGFWQSVFIPVSRILDKILFYRFGKTIIGIWSKRTA